MGVPQSDHDELDLTIRLSAAIERAAHSLRAFRQDQATARDLTPLQLELLLQLCLTEESRPRAARLAQRLDLAPPTVSSALATLEIKGLVKRRRNATDRRSSVVTATAAGAAIARSVASETGLIDALSELDHDDRATTLAALLEVIASFHRRGIVAVARTCLSCNFMVDGTSRRCTLLDIALPDDSLRVDCPEFEPRARASWAQ